MEGRVFKGSSAMAAMEGGTGHGSYAYNSNVQNYHFHVVAKPRLSHAIDRFAIPSDLPTDRRPFRIADFGCAHGRNTLDYAEFVVDRIQQRFRSARLPISDIQYFFSDLPSNDFNGLFQILKPLVASHENEETVQGLPEFYAAGVPGSFYGRLFPKASLDFAISVYSLHLLSQVPPAVLHKTSPAWNGGHAWIDGERPTVIEAYAQQFQSDMKCFLKCRAQELAKGGILFLLSLSRADPRGTYFHRYSVVTGLLDPTWNEMVAEGVVDAEERDMYNHPAYYFSRAELETAVKEVPELELLTIEIIEQVPQLPPDKLHQILNDPRMFGECMGGIARSLMKPRVEKHIGEKRAAVFFEKLQRIATEEAILIKDLASDLLTAVLRRRS